MPSPGLTKFHADGYLDFLKTHAICPLDYASLPAITSEPRGARYGEHNVVDVFRRIVLFDMVKDSSLFSNEAGCYKVITKSITSVPEQDRPNYDPCYYLPWNADGGIVETVLSPAPAMTRGRSNAVTAPPIPKGFIGSHRAAPTRQAPTLNPAAGLDPEIFFTTQLSGCSVFIKGDAREPTVFHAGAGKKIAPDPTKYWHDLFLEVAAKGGRTVGTFTEVTKNQYNYRHIENAGTETESAKMNPNLKTYSQMLIMRERRLGRPFYLHTVSGWGNVFGIRTAGLWAFYRQEVAHIIYSRKAGLEFKPGSSDFNHISRAISLVRVFPDTVVLATPQSNFKQLKH